MAQWSFERIDKIDIPNSILLINFLKPVNKANYEIIVCLKRLIKKYGEELMDEWKEIFTIITQIISNNNENSNENITKTVIDIIDIIKILIINDRFNGNVNDYANILEELRDFSNDSLYLLKTKLKLYKYYDFMQNIEPVLIEINKYKIFAYLARKTKGSRIIYSKCLD